MPNLSYPQAVTRIRALVGQKARNNFEIGDIALDQYPITPGDHTNTESIAGLTKLARDVDLDYATLYQLRFVASRVPDVYRNTSVPWSAYSDMAKSGGTDEDREKLLRTVMYDLPPAPPADRQFEVGRWTRSAVRRLLGWDNETERRLAGIREVSPYTPEPLAVEVSRAPLADRVATLDKLLVDKEVREEVKRQQEEERTARGEAGERAMRSDAILRTLDAMRARNLLERMFDRFVREAADILPRLDPRSFAKGDEDPWASAFFLRSRIAAVRGVCDQVEGLATTGKLGGDIDAFYQRVLAESKPPEGA